jgi:uncharacterized protein YaaR (DUF327 family)
MTKTEDQLTQDEIIALMEKYALAGDIISHETTVENIVAALRDADQARQIRHHIVSVCSHKDSLVSDYCDNLMRSYLAFSVLAEINSKLEATMNRWTNKFHRNLVHYLEESFD